MPVDPSVFKQVLSHWASGVTVVTGRGEPGRVHGMTASSFTSLSMNPPLVLVCVARSARTHQIIADERCFGVQMLTSGQADISGRCAGFAGEHAHWLDDLPHRIEATGAPILNEALAWMDCRLWATYDGGDHSIYVGLIEAAGAGEGSPLVWHSRGYRQLAET